MTNRVYSNLCVPTKIPAVLIYRSLRGMVRRQQLDTQEIVCLPGFKRDITVNALI